MRKPKILVVDDEHSVVQIVKTNLEIEGMQVVTAYDGVEALEKVKSENPDLLILDVMMPRMDGWDVLRELKGSPKTEFLPVVMLTALSQLDDMERGARLGNDFYLTKPFEPAELVMVVRRLLEATQDEFMRRT